MVQPKSIFIQFVFSLNVVVCVCVFLLRLAKVSAPTIFSSSSSSLAFFPTFISFAYALNRNRDVYRTVQLLKIRTNRDYIYPLHVLLIRIHA